MGASLEVAVFEGAVRRLRPVLMTASIAALGLVPLLFADGPGSEIQKPLAVVVIGGLITSTLLTLVLLPISFRRFGAVVVAGANSESPMDRDLCKLTLVYPVATEDRMHRFSARRGAAAAGFRQLARRGPWRQFRRDVRRAKRCADASSAACW